MATTTATTVKGNGTANVVDLNDNLFVGLAPTEADRMGIVLADGEWLVQSLTTCVVRIARLTGKVTGRWGWQSAAQVETFDVTTEVDTEGEYYAVGAMFGRRGDKIGVAHTRLSNVDYTFTS